MALASHTWPVSGGAMTCRVTGITVSQKQFDYARKRVADLGLADRIDIQLVDYRQMLP